MGVVSSSCVVKLSPDTPALYREGFARSAPESRMANPDVMARAHRSPDPQSDLALPVGCIASARIVDQLRSELKEAGFRAVEIHEEAGLRKSSKLEHPDIPRPPSSVPPPSRLGSRESSAELQASYRRALLRAGTGRSRCYRCGGVEAQL